MEFVRVPAGEFVMGSDKSKDPDAYDDELPQHRLTVPEFWIGRTAVTVAQYSEYVKATGRRTQAEVDGKSYTFVGRELKEVVGADWSRPRGPESNVAQKQGHPATHMSWDDALAFCAWASKLAGVDATLPSEAEWEKAARGTDGRIYPWGPEAPDASRLNFNFNERDTTPVGKYGASGRSLYGCDDMAGNVWEWTRSLWGKAVFKPEFGYSYATRQVERENLQAGRDVLRVLRGGSFDNTARDVRCAYRMRNYPYSHLVDSGFRVAMRLASV